MVNMSRDEFLDLEYVSSGNFGEVRKSGDKIYKAYKEKSKNIYGMYVDNPLLQLPLLTMLKIKRIMARGQNVEHTDLPIDLFYMDGQFDGIVGICYDGPSFLELLDNPLDEKIDLSRKLVGNSKELTDNGIYLLDQNIENVMLVNGEVKIIDTDDYFAKAPFIKNPYHLIKSTRSLCRGIYRFLGENTRSNWNKDVVRLLSRRETRLENTYNGILRYLDRKENTVLKLLFVDEEFNQNENRLLDGRTVLLLWDNDVAVDNKESVKRLIDAIKTLKSRGINVYDVVFRRDMEFFRNNVFHDECLMAEHNQVLSLTSKN